VPLCRHPFRFNSPNREAREPDHAPVVRWSRQAVSAIPNSKSGMRSEDRPGSRQHPHRVDPAPIRRWLGTPLHGSSIRAGAAFGRRGASTDPAMSVVANTCSKLYFGGMTHRIGPKGQVVIPKEIRDRVGLHPGSEVGFTLDRGRIVLIPQQPRSALGGRFRRSGMAARLLEERAREQR
jgi:AbrB family looped-hinge helix DNA binding protein